MSTLPGDDSWADAGLVTPDSSEVQPSDRTTVRVDSEHLPRAPRPDLRDEAASINDSDIEDQEESHTELLARQLGAEIIGEEKHGF